MVTSPQKKWRRRGMSVITCYWEYPLRTCVSIRSDNPPPRSPAFSCHVWCLEENRNHSFQKDEKTLCVREVHVDVRLTWHNDAIAVWIGYQKPPLQFINANAVRPSRQGSKHFIQYVGMCSQYRCVLVFCSWKVQHQIGLVFWWHICLFHQRRRKGASKRESDRQSSDFILISVWKWFFKQPRHFFFFFFLFCACVSLSNVKYPYMLWKIHSITSKYDICKVTQYQCH